MDNRPSLSLMQDTSGARSLKAQLTDTDIDSASSSPFGDGNSAPVGTGARRKIPSKKVQEPSKKVKKKLQRISDENAKLSKLVDEKDLEIEDLKKSVQSLNEILESFPTDEQRSNSSIASFKILDLNKRNHQLRLELDAKKSQLSKRDLQIQKLERNLKHATEKMKKEDYDAEKDIQEMVDLQRKYNSMRQKLFDSHNENAALQEKLKILQEKNSKASDDQIDLNTMDKKKTMAAQNACKLRGRTQETMHLQTIKELKARIEMLENDTISADDDVSSCSKYSKSKSPLSMKGAMSVDRISPKVRNSEILHRAKVEGLEKLIQELKSQVEQQKHRVLVLKVRNTNLNEEMMKYKDKLKAMEDTTVVNGMDLVTMNEQLHVQQHEYDCRLEKLTSDVKDLRERCQGSEIREEELRVKLSKAENLLSKRAAYIAELEDGIKRLETDMTSLCGNFLFSCRELRKDEFVAILDSLETEKNYLLEQNNALNLRITEERKKSDNLCDQVTLLNIRNGCLQVKISDLEGMLEIAEKEKESIISLSEYACTLNARSSVKSFVVENSNRSSPSAVVTTNHEVCELKTQLKDANEKITMLEDRLAHLVKEKEQDREIFQQTIGQSKQTMLETIMNYRGEKLEKNSIGYGISSTGASTSQCASPSDSKKTTQSNNGDRDGAASK